MSLPSVNYPPSVAMTAKSALGDLTPKDLELLDAPLIALVNSPYCRGDLRKFLAAFFSFLHRRTDFYLVPHPEDLQAGKAKMGFPEGDAEKLLLASFRQYPLRRIPSTQLQQQQQQQQQQTKGAKVPSSKDSSPSAENSLSENPPQAADSSATFAASAVSNTTTVDSTTDTVAKKAAPHADASDGAVRYTEAGKQIPVGNGGSTDRYKWTQTLEECTVLVGIPGNLRAKDLAVEFKSSHLSVKSKDGSTIFMDRTISDHLAIVPDESTWSLEGGVLILVLYKKQKTFWKSVLQGDEEIDTELVDSRRRIGEYDESTQAQIRKIMFDQEQAAKGLPTSSQILAEKLGLGAIPPPMPPTDVELPPGVEYIDQNILNEKLKAKEKEKEEK